MFRTGTAQTVATSPVTEFLTASSLANKDFVFIGGASGNYRYINRIGAGFLGTDGSPLAMAGSFQDAFAGGGGVSSGIVDRQPDHGRHRRDGDGERLLRHRRRVPSSRMSRIIQAGTAVFNGSGLAFHPFTFAFGD